MKHLSIVLVSSGVMALAGCGSKNKASMPDQAVGTYVGGGSVLGPDDCTYDGTASVFQASGPSSQTAKGPRFVFAPGTITQNCPKTTFEIKAVAPTGVAISGPAKVKRGASSELFQGHFVAGDRELQGHGQIDWTVGADCAGVATFSPVMGAQDTGGRDRGRTLEPVARGKCTVILSMTTGTTLEPSFGSKAFQTERLVTIE